MRWGWPVAAALSWCAVGAASATSLADRVHVVGGYAGKYADDAAVAKQLAELPTVANTALDTICERLGIGRATVDASRITVLVTDAASGAEAVYPTVDQAPAFTATRPGERAAAQSVVVHAEWIARPRGFDLAGVLRHELTHCVLAQRLRRDLLLPAWMEEGLAVWASGDGAEFVRRTAIFRALRRDTESVCDGLESRVEEAHRAADYAEDYLAMVHLTELAGDKAIRSLVDELIAGKDFAAAIRAVCNRGWAAFHAGARIHATAHLTGQHDPALKAAIAVLRAANARKDKITLDLATKFLAEHRDAPEIGAVLFVRAAALTNQRKLDAGRAMFEKSFERGSQFDDACIFYVATILGGTGKPADACTWWERLVRDHPESPRLPDAVFDYGQDLHAAGRTADAKTVLRKALATWPQPRDPRRADKARALLAAAGD